MALMTLPMKMRRDHDPRAVIIEKIEDQARQYGWLIESEAVGIDRMQPLQEKLGIRVTGPDVLLAVYDRSGHYTNGNILVPPSYMEDKVQGKVALILALGPLCRGSDFEEWFGGVERDPDTGDIIRDYLPKVGEWWVTSIRDGLTYLSGGGLVLKTVEWKHLRMRTLEPDLVT